MTAVTWVLMDMSSNRLKLNADKTQFIWLGSPQQLASVRMEELSIGGAAVAPVDTARDLGVTLDAQLTLDKHITSSHHMEKTEAGLKGLCIREIMTEYTLYYTKYYTIILRFPMPWRSAL